MWSILEHWISVAGPELLLPCCERVDATVSVVPDADAASRAAASETTHVEPRPAPTSEPARPEPASPRPQTPGPARAAEDVSAELERLASQAAACTACALHRERTQAVFADGSATARVMFVGEGPGRDEDREGIPFVGRAGQLLTNIIHGAMGMPRADVYIANVVKCRPPGNRNPEPDEQQACGHFLDAQIRLVAPEVLIALGSVAAHFLVETPLSVTRMRGRIWDHRGIPLVVTWHPAYLLRNPSAKRECWDDIKMALRVLGLPETPTPYRPGG